MRKKTESVHMMNSVAALKENIKYEKDIVREIFIFIRYLETIENLEKIGYKINLEEKKLLYHTTNSLVSQLKIINRSLPEIIRKVSLFKELPVRVPEKGKETEKRELVSFKYKIPSIEEKEALVTIRKAEKSKFLKELSLTDDSVRRLRGKKEYVALHDKIKGFKKPSMYAKFSNKLFSKISSNLIDRGYFNKLSRELRKANLSFLMHTYVSMAFFSSLISVFIAILLIIILLFFNVSIEYPFFTLVEESMLLRFVKYFWLIFALPTLTFFGFYFYPSAEKNSIAGRINQELPFAAIHMSAIAGSNIEPTSIFKIIVTGEEYPHTKKEFKKLLNQVNVYGYDLVSALRRSARLTSSNKLSELFTGLATTITSGGNLSEFLDKRAETLILDYRTEREKSTRVAETFMDIYISIVIAAPMIFTILLVMISINPALSFGISLQATNILMLLGIAFINVIFLVFLHFKQPEL